MKGVDTYDLCVVGSSPISLLHAIRYKFSHPAANVVVLEGEPSIGGMWRMKSVFGMENVEIGPHIMRRSKLAYEFLAEELGIGLVPMQPAPVRVITRKNKIFYIPYENDWAEHLRDAFHSIIRSPSCSWLSLKERVVSPLVKAGKSYLRYKRNDELIQRYPSQGCVELLLSLEKKLVDMGIPVLMRHYVNHIEIDRKLKISKIFTENSLIKGRFVAINPHAGSVSITMDGSRQPYATQDASTIQAHFLVQGEMSNVGFAFVGEQSGIRMASDVTQFTQGISDVYPGHKIIAAWINPDYANPEDGSSLFMSLRSLGIVSPNDSMLAYSCERLSRIKIVEEDQLKLSAALSPFLTILKTDDLTIDIERSIQCQ